MPRYGKSSIRRDIRRSRTVIQNEVANYRQRQIRSIRGRHGLLRKSQLNAQGLLDYLAQEQPVLDQLPTIRKLVKHFREDRRIWVTRDVCNEALNLAKIRNRDVLDSSRVESNLAGVEAIGLQ
jgi:hypothetical protein